MHNSQYMCVDDFGEEVYKCRYTGNPVTAGKSIFTGGMMPNVKARYIMEASQAAVKAMQKERRLFDLSEGNCNTCAKLCRIGHNPRKDGVLIGVCDVVGVLKFHPHDPLHKECYKER